MTRARDRAHGPICSAEHPSAASLDAARGRPREGEFPLPQADQAQLEDGSRSGHNRGHPARL